MRAIRFIYIDRFTPTSYKDFSLKAQSAGLIYNPAHFIVSPKNSLYKINTERGRPLFENNGLVRDSFLSTKSIGIALIFPKNKYEKKELPIRFYREVAKVIKHTLVDLGIKEFELVTSLKDEERKINIGLMHGEIKQAETGFNKINKKD